MRLQPCSKCSIPLIITRIIRNPEKPSSHIGCRFIYLFGVLRSFHNCTGHITTGSWKGRGNQYIEFARVVYCKLPTNGKQLPAFPLKAVTGIEPRPQRWEAIAATVAPRLLVYDIYEDHHKVIGSLGFGYIWLKNLVKNHQMKQQIRSRLNEHMIWHLIILCACVGCSTGKHVATRY